MLSRKYANNLTTKVLTGVDTIDLNDSPVGVPLFSHFATVLASIPAYKVRQFDFNGCWKHPL